MKWNERAIRKYNRREAKEYIVMGVICSVVGAIEWHFNVFAWGWWFIMGIPLLILGTLQLLANPPPPDA